MSPDVSQTWNWSNVFSSGFQPHPMEDKSFFLLQVKVANLPGWKLRALRNCQGSDASMQNHSPPRTGLVQHICHTYDQAPLNPCKLRTSAATTLEALKHCWVWPWRPPAPSEWPRCPWYHRSWAALYPWGQAWPSSGKTLWWSPQVPPGH